MKFLINRASDFSDIKKPCKNATVSSKTKFGREWEIEVNSLDDLFAIMEECSTGLVIERNNGGQYELTIYDGYIE